MWQAHAFGNILKVHIQALLSNHSRLEIFAFAFVKLEVAFNL